MASEEDSKFRYRIKDITFFGSSRQILLQSANGPCPLLAVCNILLLRNQIKLPQDTRYIGFEELLGLVSNFLFDANAADASGADSTSSRAANVRENLNSCLEILPRLNDGLDVNCKFAGPAEFEYTKELAVFDLLDIALYHGWIVSQQSEAYACFAHLSYNQVIERLIALQEAEERVAKQAAQTTQAAQAAQAADAEASPGPIEPSASAADAAGTGKTGSDEANAAPSSGSSPRTSQVIEQGLLIKDFLDRTASQLSYDGLLALHETVRERQLAVFFRNSHFSTMLKYQGDLYLLCTDIAFASSHLIWERLDEVDGDTSYCDADFQVNTAGSEEAAASAAAEAAQEQILAASAGPGQSTDGDAMLAWQLMQEDLEQQRAEALSAPQRAPAGAPKPVQAPRAGGLGATNGDAAPSSAAAAASGAAPVAPLTSKKDKKKSCVLQ